MLPTLIEKINVEAKNVSLTTDMWTAKNGQGYIGITCSYIDSKFNLYEVTLTVNYVRYPHTSQHIMESLEETLDEWKLREKTFTITTDNAANMKKAISDMDGIEWQGCTAHTLQLVIGKGLDNNENLAEGEQEEYIDARGTAKYLQLINDVATRWNSSYLAWSRLIYLKEWIKILLNTLSISTDLESKKDAKRLKQIMITDHEWDLIADLKEILSTFADATEELGGSKYITNSIRTQMLMEVIETVKPNSPNNENSVVDEREEDVFEVVEEQNLTSNDDINEPVITFGLLDEVKLRLYNNMKKYYPTLTTEPLIPSVLDPRFKSLDFTSKNQQSNTKQRLNELFVNEKEKYQREIGVSDLPKRSQVKPIKRKKSLMERLAKDTTVTLDEIAEYYKLPEIPLSSDPLAW
ncbi:unnamed protein product [Rhizophagus irregularis]|nr:unnamed protein product [Rhizophagus irregularis]